jgi:predicted aspartyl protease
VKEIGIDEFVTKESKKPAIEQLRIVLAKNGTVRTELVDNGFEGYKVIADRAQQQTIQFVR